MQILNKLSEYFYIYEKKQALKKKTTTATTTIPYDMAITTTKILQDYLSSLSEEIKFQCKQYYSV